MERAIKLKNDSCIKIQALARGVKARTQFEKDKVRLKKEKQARNFCVECESQVASRRCRQCKDRFCDACFLKFHKKGRGFLK